MHAENYPHAWSTELVRNPSGRAFWYVSRFVSRTRVEYLNGIDGAPRCFRRESEALAAVTRANVSDASAAGRAFVSDPARVTPGDCNPGY